MKRIPAAGSVSMILCLPMLMTGCGLKSHADPPSPAPTRTVVPENPISEIAQREILRRQERVRQMDAMALEANRALSENDLEGAVSGFRQASGAAP